MGRARMTHTNAKRYRLKRAALTGQQPPPSSPLDEFGGVVLRLWGIVLPQDDLLTLSELCQHYPKSVALAMFAHKIGYFCPLLTCPVCGQTFTPLQDRQVYCSDPCKVSAQNRRQYERDQTLRRIKARDYQRKKRNGKNERD